MKSGSAANSRAQREPARLGVLLHRLDDSASERLTSSGKRSSGIGRAMLRRSSSTRLTMTHLALDGRAEGLAVFRVVEHLLRSACSCCRCSGSDARDRGPGRRRSGRTSPGVPASDVLLELDEAVGHGVEGVAELIDFVLRRRGRRASSRWPSAIARRARVQGEDAADERAAPADSRRSIVPSSATPMTAISCRPRRGTAATPRTSAVRPGPSNRSV